MMRSLLLLLLTACMQTAYAQKDFQSLHGLAGLWKMETGRGPIYEEWKVQSDHQLAGKSYKINNGDTIVLENVTLFLDGNKIIYSPVVTNQNKGQAVRFTLISGNDQRYIFENKEHDFPQRVIYHLVSKDAVHARIEGTKNGKQMGSDFKYTRIN